MSSKELSMQLPKAIHELEYGQGSMYGPEEEAALHEVLCNGAPSCGPKVKQFEESFASYCGAPWRRMRRRRSSASSTRGS
jgi:dTDP-4-amino-4,6-dideoxygalactose transaminase